MYVRELQARYRQRRIKDPVDPLDILNRPSEAARLLTALLRSEIAEVCILLCLDTQHHLVAFHEVSRGTVDHTIVEARDIFKIALLANARSIVVGHNHPSGDTTPSSHDHKLTTRIAIAGALIGIPLDDHLVVAADGRYASFREMGLL